MSGGNNGNGTAHKDGEDTDIQELEEPETLDVVIDGTSPSDYPDEENWKRWRLRVLLAVSAFVVVSVTLGISFGLTAKSNSPPAQSASAPKSVDSPTQSPSSAPPTSVNEFMNGLPSYSKELASTNASSPQAKALTWLQGDPQYNEYELYRLYQRYSLAVLYYTTNGTSWNNKMGWLSNYSECTWSQNDDDGKEDDVTCVDGSRLAFLDLFGSGLSGSFPTELELLTDLEYMYLDGLSGPIHSEL
jgi:hypothetical protein